MPTPITWSNIDINPLSKGYLDSTEVRIANGLGIENVFIGMIQEEYYGELNVDSIVHKYDKGSFGRIPMSMAEPEHNDIKRLYRELTILKIKYTTMELEFTRKYGLWDDFKDFVSKQIGIIKEDKEYTEAKKQLNDMLLNIGDKELELTEAVDKYRYKNQRKTEEN